MRVVSAAIGVMAAIIFAAPAVHPQATARPLPSLRVEPALQGEYALEVEARDRWVHQRQLARATPFASHRSWFFVDSLRDSAGGRRMHLTIGRSRYGRDSALIVTDAGGRVTHLEVGVAACVRGTPSFPDDSAYWLRRVHGLTDGGFALAEARLWDLVPTFPRAAARVGLRWTDTLARVATSGPFRQSLRGTRISRITADTVVYGRHLWVVRDSAHVQYEDVHDEQERTLATTDEVSRVASGIVTGVHLYDPTLRLFRARDDTTRLEGTAELRYADGRSFRTPARYERVQHWRLSDSAGYSARMATLRSQNDFGGMVIIPGNDLQRRLASGDGAARDSIIGAWQRAVDPDSAVSLSRLFTLWVRDEPARARFDSVRIAAGDTAFLYEQLAQRAYPTRSPLTAEDVRAMLRFMDDPAAVWALNVSRERLYEDLVQTMTTWPRAAQGSSPGRFTTCTIDACRLLEAQWREAREPRLRDVGLVALVTGDPRRWVDTLLTLDAAQHPLLVPAFHLARGAGATWQAASKAPLPPPNSDWHAWLEWMNGRDPSYVTLGPPRAAPAVRFEESHSTALRFYGARTGRDVVAEIRSGYEAADSDSARLVFGTMLQRLGGLSLTEAQVAEAFASGDPARIELARVAMVEGLRSGASAVLSGASAAPFVGRLVASLVDTIPLWSAGTADLRAVSGRSRPIVHAQVQRVLLNGDNLPDIVRAEWKGRIEIISSAEWNRRDVRAAGVFYTVSAPRAWGRFVQIQLSDSERLSRRADQLPAQYAAADTYFLMELNGEWVIVAAARMVT